MIKSLLTPWLKRSGENFLNLEQYAAEIETLDLGQYIFNT